MSDTTTTTTNQQFYQECFNKMVRDIVAQGGGAFSPLGKCKYRTADGKRCHVGMLILPEFYSPDLEEHTPSDSRVAEALHQSLGRDLSGEDLDFFTQAQEAHDNSVDARGWHWDDYRTFMQDLARDYGLKPDVLTVIPL